MKASSNLAPPCASQYKHLDGVPAVHRSFGSGAYVVPPHVATRYELGCLNIQLLGHRESKSWTLLLISSPLPRYHLVAKIMDSRRQPIAVARLGVELKLPQRCRASMGRTALVLLRQYMQRTPPPFATHGHHRRCSKEGPHRPDSVAGWGYDR